MFNSVLILIGKSVALTSRLLNLGHGSTWPGHIALSANKNFIRDLLKKNPRLQIILIAGTNGKTTTGKLIQTILEKDRKKVFQNESGANLLNGIASSILLRSNILGELNYDFAIFEVDENTLPLVLSEITPQYLILLNLFRDQLDRYGEVNSIASKWKQALNNIPDKTTLLLNADDPQIAYFGSNSRGGVAIPPPRWNHRYTSVFYFGIDDKSLAQKPHQHASDSSYCPSCQTKLSYRQRYFSHLGNWHCTNCKLSRPRLNLSKTAHYPLPGLYIRYNTHAAVLLAQKIDLDQKIIDDAISDFEPAFGRQERFEVDKRNVQIFLSKNPTSFNESLRTVKSLGAKHLLLILNDRIPDGRDISWIWDVDFETLLSENQHIHVSGDRAFDMALRIKYAHPAVKHLDTYPLLEKLFEGNIFQNLKDDIKNGDTLYILPTYSAMLEVRNKLTGKKIL